MKYVLKRQTKTYHIEDDLNVIATEVSFEGRNIFKQFFYSFSTDTKL